MMLKPVKPHERTKSGTNWRYRTEVGVKLPTCDRVRVRVSRRKPDLWLGLGFGLGFRLAAQARLAQG